MGLIITPNTGGITYPNISDSANVVTINPSVETLIQSDFIYLQSNLNDVVIQSPGGGITISASGTVVCAGSKFGVFGNNTGQPAAIINANPATAHDVVNEVLDVLRAYGLIAT